MCVITDETSSSKKGSNGEPECHQSNCESQKEEGTLRRKRKKR